MRNAAKVLPAAFAGLLFAMGCGQSHSGSVPDTGEPPPEVDRRAETVDGSGRACLEPCATYCVYIEAQTEAGYVLLEAPDGWDEGGDFELIRTHSTFLAPGESIPTGERRGNVKSRRQELSKSGRRAIEGSGHFEHNGDELSMEADLLFELESGERVTVVLDVEDVTPKYC